MKAPDNDVNKLSEEITVEDFDCELMGYGLDENWRNNAAKACYDLALKMVTAASNKTASGKKGEAEVRKLVNEYCNFKDDAEKEKAIQSLVKFYYPTSSGKCYVAISVKDRLPKREGWYNVFNDAEPNLASQVWYSFEHGFQTKHHETFPVTYWLDELFPCFGEMDG